jgi:hypothetical protein
MLYRYVEVNFSDLFVDKVILKSYIFCSGSVIIWKVEGLHFTLTQRHFLHVHEDWDPALGRLSAPITISSLIVRACGINDRIFPEMAYIPRAPPVDFELAFAICHPNPFVCGRLVSDGSCGSMNFSCLLCHKLVLRDD